MRHAVNFIDTVSNGGRSTLFLCVVVLLYRCFRVFWKTATILSQRRHKATKYPTSLLFASSRTSCGGVRQNNGSTAQQHNEREISAPRFQINQLFTLNVNKFHLCKLLALERQIKWIYSNRPMTNKTNIIHANWYK